MKKNYGCFILALVAGIVLLGTASLATAAVDNVRCIPWQGDTAKYHTAISGQSAQLKGVIDTTDTSTVWYKWVFGDGSESAVTALSGATRYKVSINHTYTGVSETPFTAQLLVDDVDSSMANAVADPYFIKLQEDVLDARVNIAIDKGLWWLYTNNSSNPNFHTLDGSPFMVWSQSSYGWFFASPTASAIQAFAINNHKVTGDFAEDPYAEAVQLGLNWLTRGYYYSSTSYPMLQAVGIGTTGLGDNPEEGQTSPNGLGIQVRDYAYRPIYEGGQVMDAIISSGVAPGDDTGRNFNGRPEGNWTYGELLQDMVDMYAWGQYDNALYGGWRYNWNDWPDNSACQWAAIGMIPAQKAPWNCTVPDWVKTYNANWLTYSHRSWTSGGINYGGFGYTGPGNGWGESPSGLVQMIFDGQVGYDDPVTPADERDPKWIRTERYFADYWNTFIGSTQTYGWYAFAKAMRLAQPKPVERLVSNNFDWYHGSGGIKGMAQNIVERQTSAGYWAGNYTDYPLTTAWMVITLNPTPFLPGPTACFTANPNPSYAGYNIIFDPSCSDHADANKDIGNIVLFEWDWDNDGTYDQSTSAPDEVTHAFACAAVPCVYPVTLRVTDDNVDPISASFTLNVNITNPPHPPVADAEGPYMVSLCQDDTLTLDGSGSFDIDEGEHEAGCTTCPGDTITAWDWDLVPPLAEFDNESGATVTVVPGDYFAAGVHNVGLRVSDNTALSFPGSGEPDLTDTDFTTVSVSEGCLCDLTVRAKLDKAQLVWTHTGAASYDIYRSTSGPNSGFTLIADDHVTTYATYLDTGLTIGTTYWYRVVGSDGCGSQAVSVTPALRTR